MKPRPKEYETYLVILPGELIYQLYEEFGARLFEFNVRSFLQAKGKVNKGLRDTLRNEPERFLAYNNGITATADEIEAGLFMGEMTISRVRGLQIVNGAQTTASIHRAKKADKIDIGKRGARHEADACRAGQADGIRAAHRALLQHAKRDTGLGPFGEQ